ncbi:MAG: hypothetical protein JXR61_05530, partial [Prolixibacteraceae bacterium]|nr:hypothetical protein [Prolixibacteraceae bacterium]
VPVYPEVVALSEKDMLVIKETLNRVSNSTLEIDQVLIQKLIDKVEGALGIKAKLRNTAFLRTLIKDYVALTR